MLAGGVFYKHQAKEWHACIRKCPPSCSSVSVSITLFLYKPTMQPVFLLNTVSLHESCMHSRLLSCRMSAGWEYGSCKTSLGW